MTVKRKLHQLLIVVFAIVLSSVAVALIIARPDQTLSISPSESTREAVAMLRLVNDAEFRFHQGTGTYGTWEQLNASSILQVLESSAEAGRSRRGAPPSPLSELNLAAPQPVPNYTMTTYVSQNGSHYLCEFRNVTTAPCGPSFYSDDRSVILEAEPIGCNQASGQNKPGN